MKRKLLLKPKPKVKEKVLILLPNGSNEWSTSDDEDDPPSSVKMSNENVGVKEKPPDVLKMSKPIMSNDMKMFNSEVNILENPMKQIVSENVQRLKKSDDEFIDQFKFDSEITDPKKLTQMKQILLKYRNTFGEHDYDVSNYSAIKLHIDTGNNSPIAVKHQIPVPLAIRPAVKEVLDCMEKEGIIRKSSSPWAMPLMIVYKKDGRIRPVVDYRPLNRILKKDQYPLPRIEDLLANMNGNSYFTTFDLNSGFYNIEVDDESKEKTAFSCFKGLYEYNRVPMGLSNSPAVMQRLANTIIQKVADVNKALGKCNDDYIMTYIDDIIVKSKSWEEHLVHLENVFHVLKDMGLKLKASKTRMCQRKVIFLGFQVSEAGIEVDPSKTDHIRNIPAPTSQKEVQKVNGFFSYYRKFIPNYAKIAQPMTQLLHHKVIFEWTEKCEDCLNMLKDILLDDPILHHPDLNGNYVLETDASKYGYGAILSQEKDGVLRPIAFASKATNHYEQIYAPCESEAAAIIYGVKKFETYIKWRKCTVYTDHRGLQYLLTGKLSNARLQRWAVMLQDFNLDIIYRAGKKSSNVDLLSRIGMQDKPKKMPLKRPETVKFVNFPEKLTKEEIPLLCSKKLEMRNPDDNDESENEDDFTPREMPNNENDSLHWRKSVESGKNDMTHMISPKGFDENVHIPPELLKHLTKTKISKRKLNDENPERDKPNPFNVGNLNISPYSGMKMSNLSHETDKFRLDGLTNFNLKRLPLNPRKFWDDDDIEWEYDYGYDDYESEWETDEDYFENYDEKVILIKRIKTLINLRKENVTLKGVIPIKKMFNPMIPILR